MKKYKYRWKWNLCPDCEKEIDIRFDDIDGGIRYCDLCKMTTGIVVLKLDDVRNIPSIEELNEE